MGWAAGHISRLAAGESVSFRPRGSSMRGRVEDGELVTVCPLAAHELGAGDVVLCRVRGAEYLHLIKAVQGKRYLIGNNRGGVNGWIGRQGIFGLLVR
ncbi:MAG: S24/S26 family peptidase [Myxococcales bacterium]|nr:S24/S26 family peptidase [Myxococcales bacterium]